MKKFVLFILCFCLVMPMQVFAMEPSQEETIEETVVDMVDEMTDTETVEDDTEMIEVLKDINNNIIITQFAVIFMIMIHYSEKWFKIMNVASRK